MFGNREVLPMNAKGEAQLEFQVWTKIDLIN